MALTAAKIANASDTQVLMLALTCLMLTGGAGGTIYNPPPDAQMTQYQLEVLRPLVYAELYKRGLAHIKLIDISLV